jgi:tripartite-type tricarboxylate transporter receptor subunit TctC
MPAELINQINGAIQKSLSDEKLLDNFTKGSLEAVGGTPEQLGKLARADSEKYERLVRELNISAG